MPKINVYTSDVSPGADSALISQVVNTNAEATRMRQQGLNALSQGMQNLSQGLISYGQAKQKIDDNLFMNEVKNAADKAAANAENFALTNPDSSPDGSSIMTDYQEGVDSEADFFMDGLSDSQKAKAQTIFTATKNERLDRVFTAQRERHGQFVIGKSDELKKGMELSAFQNPDSFMQSSVRMSAMYGDMVTSGLVNKAQADSLTKQGIEDLAVNTVHGEINKRNYDGAKERVISGDLSMALDSETRTKVLDLIDREKVQSLDIDLKNQAMTDSRDKKMKELQSQKVMSNFLTEAAQATDDAGFENLAQKALAARAKGIIGDEEYRFITSVKSDRAVRYDDTFELGYRDTMTRTDDLRSLQDQIVADPKVNPKTKIDLLGQIRIREDAIRANPANNEKIKFADDLIDAAFAPGMVELDPKPRLTNKAFAKKRMSDLISQGLDPMEAGKQSVREFAPPMESLPKIPGLGLTDQEDSAKLDQLSTIYKQQYAAGKLGKDLYLQYLKNVAVRKKRIEVNSIVNLLAPIAPPTQGQ